MKLNKTKVYSLEDLTSEEYEKLFKWLLGNDSGWRTVHFESWKNNNIGFNLKHNGSNWSMQEVKPTTNAKELFYTLENVQVDCSELTEEQVKEMADVFEANGFKIWDSDNALNVGSINYLLELTRFGVFTSIGSEEKTTITYSKFMELFAEPQQEVKDKPKHYSKGIDTFARMEANCTKEECLAFAKGNIDKYNFRTKGQDLEDYKKIVSYAQWAIKLLKDEN